MKNQKNKSLIGEPLEVLNIGLEGFAKELEEQNFKVTHIDWSPPAGGDAELANLLSKLGS